MAFLSPIFGFKASLPDGQGPVNPAAVQAAQKTIQAQRGNDRLCLYANRH